MSFGDQDETQEIIGHLLKELEITEFEQRLNLEPDLQGVLDLLDPAFTKIAPDVMTLAGVSGDWEFSLKVTERYCSLHKISEEQWAAGKLWQLRCLVELERMSEALALSQSIRWLPKILIHANYLTGKAFEALDMTEQAKQRFEAVFRENPRFRDIAERVLKE